LAPVIGSPASLTLRHRRGVCWVSGPPLAPVPRGWERVPMPIRIGDGVMRLEIDGRVVATATERAGGWWEVIYWPRFFDRNQAITALTVTELLESGRDAGDPVVAALREELR